MKQDNVWEVVQAFKLTGSHPVLPPDSETMVLRDDGNSRVIYASFENLMHFFDYHFKPYHFRRCYDFPVGRWDCSGSPIGKCVYDHPADPAHDDCIYCHFPEKRK